MATTYSSVPVYPPPGGARIVPDFPHYCVTARGVVYSCKVRGSHAGKLGDWWPMKLKDSGQGYYCVNLYRQPNRPERKMVHQLVMQAFVGPCPPGMEVRHLDGDRKNNRLTNLCYGTKAENMDDAIYHGDLPVGEDCYLAKRTNEQIRTIRELNRQGMSCRAIADLFGMRPSYVYRIVHREIWKHV